ncbi:MAG: sigma-70 family RNA polymerase sigma factor [Chloroflexota bacterium]|nr:sigma-70 family RNA polymerase sigma factor [Chloroflexota bacterium]
MMTDSHSTSTPIEPIDALITRAVAGDQGAFAALYDRLAPAVYRLCYSVLLHREDAEDVMQEAFVYAFRNLRCFDPAKSAFKTWLFTIAISRCRNQRRRFTPPLLDITEAIGAALVSPRDEQPETAYAHASARQSLEVALRRLPSRLREAVVLRYGHGLTYREIAEVMVCPQKTAESRVRLAHEALRGLLPSAQGLLEELAI